MTYTRLSDENHEWLSQTAGRTGLSMTSLIDKAVSALRTGYDVYPESPVHIEKRETSGKES